ncbi:MAG: ATPase [Thermoplasmata archaeon]|nr:MAG: ATPase [Thermoplasmata archaeon]KAA0011047.1 MAG: ATPase [Thermoplasmata archaeon]OYT61638.1 MAG: ATPase [Thermoplasmatales archaeon ex4484_30]
MPKFVIKKDGRKEEFIPEKIVVSAIKSGASAEIARDIAKKVEKIEREEIETREIRDIVLHELKSVNPDWHQRWLSYDKGVKRLYKHYRHGLYE